MQGAPEVHFFNAQATLDTSPLQGTQSKGAAKEAVQSLKSSGEDAAAKAQSAAQQAKREAGSSAKGAQAQASKLTSQNSSEQMYV